MQTAETVDIAQGWADLSKDIDDLKAKRAAGKLSTEQAAAFDAYLEGLQKQAAAWAEEDRQRAAAKERERQRKELAARVAAEEAVAQRHAEKVAALKRELQAI